jgi:hypothetical protein
VRLSLDRAEARILGSPDDMSQRFAAPHGRIVDRSEPNLLLMYEQADDETIAWVDWLDLLRRPEHRAG